MGMIMGFIKGILGGTYYYFILGMGISLFIFVQGAYKEAVGYKMDNPKASDMYVNSGSEKDDTAVRDYQNAIKLKEELSTVTATEMEKRIEAKLKQNKE